MTREDAHIAAAEIQTDAFVPRGAVMEHKAYILRTCNADMSSRNGFIWPREGVVECLDWKPTTKCGNGLHGALWGEGDGSLLDWSDDAVWVVAGVDEWIDINGKVKFPRADVVFAGPRDDAVAEIINRGAKGAVIGRTATAGDRGTATAGDYGRATAGDRGTATAGDYGRATAGYRGTATAGDYGRATAGYGGTATAGYGGTATAGYGGTATAGYRGTATAGYGGTATAGDRGTATAGDYGVLLLSQWDGQRRRVVIAYVGEGGVKPNTAYRLRDGKLVEA